MLHWCWCWGGRDNWTPDTHWLPSGAEYVSSRFSETSSLKKPVEYNRERCLDPPSTSTQICTHKNYLRSHVYICMYKPLDSLPASPKRNSISAATNSDEFPCLSTVDIWDRLLVYWGWGSVFCRMFHSSLAIDFEILTSRCGIQKHSWINSANG